MSKLRMIWNIIIGRTVMYKVDVIGTAKPQSKHSACFTDSTFSAPKQIFCNTGCRTSKCRGPFFLLNFDVEKS